MLVSFVLAIRKLTAASGHYAPSRGNEAQIDINTPYVM